MPPPRQGKLVLRSIRTSPPQRILLSFALVILTGEIDVSVGATLGITATISDTPSATLRRDPVYGAPIFHAAWDGARGHVRAGVHVHSLRLPGLVATQDVVFGGPGEVLTIRHDAMSRECYLPGVVLAVRAISGRVGLVRGLEALLDL